MSSLVLATCLCAMGDSVEFRLEIYRMNYKPDHECFESNADQREFKFLKGWEERQMQLVKSYIDISQSTIANLQDLLCREASFLFRHSMNYQTSESYGAGLYILTKCISRTQGMINGYYEQISKYESQIEIYFYKKLSQERQSSDR